MDDELRAADPTLAAMDRRLVTVTVPEIGMLEAHDEDCAHAWGPRLPAWSVAYQAVPCRECFPDAPPAGLRPAVGCPCAWHSGGDGLAWQAASSRQPDGGDDR